MSNLFIRRQTLILRHVFIESYNDIKEILEFTRIKRGSLRIQQLEVLKLDSHAIDELIQIVHNYQIQTLIFHSQIWKGILDKFTKIKGLEIIYSEALSNDIKSSNLEKLTYFKDKIGILNYPENLRFIEFRDIHLQFISRITEIVQHSKIKTIQFTQVKFSYVESMWMELLKLELDHIIFDRIEVTLTRADLLKFEKLLEKVEVKANKKGQKQIAVQLKLDDFLSDEGKNDIDLLPQLLPLFKYFNVVFIKNIFYGMQLKVYKIKILEDKLKGCALPFSDYFIFINQQALLYDQKQHYFDNKKSKIGNERRSLIENKSLPDPTSIDEQQRFHIFFSTEQNNLSLKGTFQQINSEIQRQQIAMNKWGQLKLDIEPKSIMICQTYPHELSLLDKNMHIQQYFENLKLLNLQKLSINFSGVNMFDDELKEQISLHNILTSVQHMTKLQHLRITSIFPSESSDQGLITFFESLPLNLEYFKFDYTFYSQTNSDAFLETLYKIQRRNIQIINYSLQITFHQYQTLLSKGFSANHLIFSVKKSTLEFSLDDIKKLFDDRVRIRDSIEHIEFDCDEYQNPNGIQIPPMFSPNNQNLSQI